MNALRLNLADGFVSMMQFSSILLDTCLLDIWQWVFVAAKSLHLHGGCFSGIPVQIKNWKVLSVSVYSFIAW